MVVFFINGVSSLLGWNAVLAALDYFGDSYMEYNVYSFLPLPLFIGYIAIGLSFHEISNRYRYSIIIVVGNTIVSISLLGLLITSMFLDQTLLGFVISLLFSFMIGLGGNLGQLCFFAMINYLSRDVVSKFTVGTAVSGLFMGVTRAILTIIFGAGNTSTTPIVIYFIIAIFFNTLDTLMNIRFCKSDVYKHKIDRFLLHHDKEKETHEHHHAEGEEKMDKSIILSEVG